MITTATDHAGHQRPAALCYAGWLLCPRCGESLRRIHAKGPIFASCSARTPDPTRPGSTKSCGQHIYAICMWDVCAVVAISREEFQRLRTDQRDPWEVLRDLGVLLTPQHRDMAA